MSVAPPAGKPTMMRTGRDGQAWARAIRGIAGNAAAPAAKARNVRRGKSMMRPPQSAHPADMQSDRTRGGRLHPLGEAAEGGRAIGWAKTRAARMRGRDVPTIGA